MKGAIEVPAVMIFVVVAGSLILLFFVTLVLNQGESAEQGIQASSLQRMDTLLKGAGTAKETANNITISDEPLLYECNELTGARFYYETGIDMPVYNQVLFSPGQVDGGQMRTYSKASTNAYRVTTILYITSSEHVLQYLSELEGFPPNFPVRQLASAGDADSRWRLVILDDTSITTPNMHPNVVRVLRVPGTDYGTVEYYSNGAITGSAVYPNQELLYGALLSEDAATYKCMLSNYLGQLQWVNTIERQRLLSLKDANLATACYEYYQEFPYADIADLPKQGSAFTIADAEALETAANQIEYMNDNLIRRGGQTCAWLY